MDVIDLGIDWQEKEETEFCVTEILRYTEDPFNKKQAANNIFLNKFIDPTSQYYQMTPEQIIEQWDKKRLRSQEVGHALDDFTGIITEPARMKDHQDITMESWLSIYKNDEEITRIAKAWYGYWKKLEERGFKMVRREQHFHKDYAGHSVRGRSDMILYYKPTNTITIIDWKTSEDITCERKKHFGLHGPKWCAGLAQEKLTHYGLQVNTYHHMLEDLIPKDKQYNISECIIQITRNGQVNYYKNPIPYVRGDMQELIEWCVNERVKNPDLYADC